MAYFTEDFLKFFTELAANNTREWFDKNRSRYEKTVKEPFAELVEAMIVLIHQHDADVLIQPKDAIFRINRDIRFSEDKRPYKTTASAIISPGGRKDKSVPGFYFELSATRTMIAGGAYFCEKEGLEKLRYYIAEHANKFHKLLATKDFREKFGEIQGEKNKRLTGALQKAAEKEPLLFNKQFYYYSELPPQVALRDDLTDILMSYYRAGEPVMQFLRRALAN